MPPRVTASRATASRATAGRPAGGGSRRGRARREAVPRELYGLALPGALRGVTSVIAIDGTGRLWRMAAQFGPQRLTERSDLARISADLHENLHRLDGLDELTGGHGERE